MDSGIVRNRKDYGHENKRYRDLSKEGDPCAQVAWSGDNIIHRWMRDSCGKNSRNQEGSGYSSEELRGDIKDRIPRGNLAEPIERKGC